MENTQRTYAFIDASNLFYGGEKSLGWSIDYQKLFEYLRERYGVTKVLYFGGVEIYRYKYDYLTQETVPINELIEYLDAYVGRNKERLTEARLALIDRHMRRVKQRVVAQHLRGAARAVGLVDANGVVQLEAAGAAAVVIDAGISLGPGKVGLWRGPLGCSLGERCAEPVGCFAFGDGDLPRLRIAPAGYMPGRLHDTGDHIVRHRIGPKRTAGIAGFQNVSKGIDLGHYCCAMK